MPPDLVEIRLLQPVGLFYPGSEVKVTSDVADAWCKPGRGVAEYVNPSVVPDPPKRRGRPKKQVAEEEPSPAPLGLSTEDLV